MQLLDDPYRLAKLLASINVPGADRPLSPLEVSNEIYTLRSELDDDAELVKRLPISRDIIQQFLALQNLPEEIQDIIVWGESKNDTGSIGFSVASRLAQFENKEDINKLASAIIDIPRPVIKEEIKAILSLKKQNKNKPIEECISEVLKVMRPLIIRHFLFISGLQSGIINKLKLSVKSNQNIHGLAIEILQTVFPTDSVKSAKVFDDCIRLSISKNGRDFIDKYSESHNLLRKDIINHMFESKGF